LHAPEKSTAKAESAADWAAVASIFKEMVRWII